MTMKTRAATLALAVALAACATVPSTPAPPSGWSGPFDAARVLERAVAAAGGPAAVALPPRVHTVSRIVLHRPDGAPVHAEFHYWAEGAQRERREVVTADGHHLVQVIDGSESIEIEDGVATGRSLVADATARRRYRGLLMEMAASPESARLVTDPGCDPEQEIVVERKFGEDRWQLWLDAHRYLVTRIRRIETTPQGAIIEEDFLSGHERVGDRVVPHRQVTWRDGQRLKEAWLLEYDDDPTFDPDLFQTGSSR